MIAFTENDKSGFALLRPYAIGVVNGICEEAHHVWIPPIVAPQAMSVLESRPK